jgi:hypothetical protein
MSKVEKDTLYIKSIIESNNPFFIGRIAGCELKVAYNYLKNDMLNLKFDLLELENNAGIKISSPESLKAYIDALIRSYESCTLIAEWDTTGKVFEYTGIGQQLILNRTQTIPKINALALEPYYFKESWMPSLKGKKILIIHPFTKTLKKQTNNIKSLFPSQPSWFEDCEFEFVEPPYTLAGNHQNIDWDNHYNIFIQRLKEVKEFDIALVAAGGYGMLISDYIFKELGKSVIYIGGALQLFFGVIGKRWFENQAIMKLVNDDWIRPDKEDRPQNYTNVEKGCYW